MGRGSGTVTVSIVGKVANLRSALGQAEGDLKKFGDTAEHTGGRFGKMGGAVQAAGSAMLAAGIGTLLKDSADAAAEDEAAQAKLAKTLKNTVGATDAVVKSVEGYISKAMRASTFSDDELRPAFENLVRSTRDATEANTFLKQAMDIAAATGKPLEQVSMAIAKAHDGNVGALGRLGIATKDASGQTLSFEQVMLNASGTFGGSAANALDTSAGKATAFKRDLGELQEQVGAALLPVMAKLTEVLSKIVDWFSNLSPGVQKVILAVGGAAVGFVALGSVISTITGAFAAFGVTLTVSLGPIAAVVAAIAGAIAIGVLIVKNWDTIKAAASSVWEWVRDRFNQLVGFITGIPGQISAAAKGMFDGIKNAFRSAINWVIRAWNGLDFKIPGFDPPGPGPKFGGFTLGLPQIPELADGAIVKARPGGILANIGEGRFDEAVVPLNGRAGLGGGTTVTIQTGPIVGMDAPSLARWFVDLLLDEQRRSGPLGLKAG